MNENDLTRYIEKYHSTVFRLSFGYVKNHEDAEDIVQDAFLKLYTTEIKFESDENVKAWLIRVAINLSKDLLKSHWFKRRAELSSDIPADTNEEETLSACIKKLKPEYSTILFLFYYEGYSTKEIAEICRISVSAVTTRLARARKQLKNLLLKEGYYEK